MMNNINEPKESFPYIPPSDKLKSDYYHIFQIDKPLPQRFIKRVFDIFFSSIFILISLPILLLLKILFLIEGTIDRSSAGPLTYFYWAKAQDKLIKKRKIRVVKLSHVNKDLMKKHDWLAWSVEWNEEARTNIGRFVKAFYLDEIPQLFSIFLGEMSFVGPRPLSVLHYDRDIAQGNVSRKLIKGGLLGFGHIRKGTAEFGDPSFEYEYIDACMNLSWYQLLKLDIWIIYKGLLVVLKGKGL